MRIDPRTSRQAVVLLAAVGCVLLITCVDVASVLLARGRFGVVGDVKYGSIDEPPSADFYTSFRQFTYPDTMMIVRTAEPLRAIVPAIRTAVATVDPALPVYDVQMLDDRVDAALSRPRVTASVLAAFAAAAMLLAGFGVYGVTAHSVALRRREIGIRLALGAGRAQTMRTILGEAGRQAVCGLVIGLASAVVAGRLVGTLLVGVSGRDPLVLAGVTVVVGVAAVAAAFVPARRASQVDPAVVLRAE